MRRALAAGAVLAAGLAYAGCARIDPPANMSAGLYDPEKSSDPGRTSTTPSFSQNTCPPPGTTQFLMPAGNHGRKSAPPRDMAMRYSPGDRLNMFVFGSPEFSGDYAVNADGVLLVPYAGAVDAVGLTNTQLTARVETALVRAGIFRRESVRITLRPMQYAPINVTISGAVFLPGRHAINGLKDSDKMDRFISKYGDSPIERFVPAALRAAGGVRPDAEVSRIKLTRAGKVYQLDWRGAFTGAPVDDMPLIEGDHIDVPEADCFQSAMMRPSQITAPGIRIFTSNLTAPGITISADPKFTYSIPYGTRFLQGLVTAHCVGGSLATNARRYGVLISRNPKTHQTEVIQRSIEDLVRSADRDAINPYLMPDDAIACYDSAVTDVKEVAQLLQAMVLPYNTAWGAKLVGSK